MRECKQQMPLCQCIDWKCGDMAIGIHHLMYNFEFQRFSLEYGALEPGEPRCLCMIGRCRVCGNRLCIGVELPAQDNVDDFLTKTYRWMYQMWKNTYIPAGTKTFPEMFLDLYHDSDRTFVSGWLSLPENQHIGQMYRHSRGEDK